MQTDATNTDAPAEMQSQPSETTHQEEPQCRFPGSEATYCPEDDKLRLYVGRVPRPDYDRLRAEGWTATPKQSCDFAAVWTITRRNTALEFCGEIGDEDVSPEERAADRAERFAGYRDKRTAEATGHADRYDAGPSVHGYQSQARAERSANRHDRIAGRAVDAWSKADYWTTRTAGVISHALYKSAPGVRMGRIKTLEAELRRVQANYTPRDGERLMQEPRDGGEKVPHVCVGQGRAYYWQEESKLEAIKAHYADWENHLKFRIAYELQMLGDQGGRLEQFDVQAGGKLGGRLILKANKSSTTGRITSVSCIGPRVEVWHYQVSNIPHTDLAEYYFELERLSVDAYTPPTPETLAELAALKAKIKAARPKTAPCPLINPTDEDAERLQALWNAHALAAREASYKRQHYSLPVTDCPPQKPLRMTQARYSEFSKGEYAACSTRGVFRGGFEQQNYYRAAQDMREKHGREVCMIRRTRGDDRSASRVIILTDKPQKPLPAEVWTPAAPAEPAPSPQVAATVQPEFTLA